VPGNSPTRIRLTGTLPTGTAGALALVGRTGPDLTSGDVTTKLTPLPAGGIGAVELDGPAQYGRITAIVVNSDVSKGGFDSTADDYIFTRDASDVTVAMAEPGPPVPTTGAAGLIGDHSALIGGTVDPHMLDTKWQVEYGQTVGYGTMTKAQPMPASTVAAGAISVPIGDLKANTTYHYRVFATNGAGVTAGRDMTFKTARDVTKPTVTLAVKKQRLSTLRRRGLTYSVKCSERCRGTAELVLSRSLARRLRLPTVIARTSLSLKPTSRLAVKHLRLSRRGKGVLQAQRRLSARLVVSVTDESRNRRVASKRTTLLPR
jgi:hypothetical protein